MKEREKKRKLDRVLNGTTSKKRKNPRKSKDQEKQRKRLEREKKQTESTEMVDRREDERH